MDWSRSHLASLAQQAAFFVLYIFVVEPKVLFVTGEGEIA